MRLRGSVSFFWCSSFAFSTDQQIQMLYVFEPLFILIVTCLTLFTICVLAHRLFLVWFLQVFSAPMGQILDRLESFGEFEVTVLIVWLYRYVFFSFRERSLLIKGLVISDSWANVIGRCFYVTFLFSSQVVGIISLPKKSCRRLSP